MVWLYDMIVQLFAKWKKQSKLSSVETKDYTGKNMGFKFSQKSINKLNGVHDDLVKVMTEAIKHSPYDFGITSGLRTVTEQKALYDKGRTPESIAKGEKPVTWTMNSRHLTGHAVDIVVYVDGKMTWDEKYYDIVASHILGIAAKNSVPLVWGGSFKSRKDRPHFELNKSFYKGE